MKKTVISLVFSLIICTMLISCDMSIITDIISPEHIHEYGEWTVSRKVNCLKDGTETRTCSCGEVETRTVKSPGHIPGEWNVTKDATCSEEGLRSNKCSVCFRPLTEEVIPTADHNFIEVDTVKPGCLNNGYTLLECSVCEEESAKDHVPALGHDCTVYDRYNLDATATKDGTVSGTCSRCKGEAKKPLVGSAALMSNAFGDKKIAVLGDSISTFYGVSNGTAADTTNSTIRDSVLYYDEAHAKALGVTRESTWWQRTADALGSEILVNNSWSGSYILDTSTNTRPTPGAYLNRCENLHDDTGADAGKAPDMIFVYLGTNDYYKYKSNCGTATAIDYDSLPEKLGDDYVPKSVAEAYAIMLYKMKAAYPSAEIYCLNVLESRSSDSTLATFNNMIKGVAEAMDCKYVDICENSGIKDNEYYENYVPTDDGDGSANSLHPNAAGMRAISECVLDVILKESKCAPDFDALIKN